MAKSKYLLPNKDEIKMMQKMRREGVVIDVICRVFDIAKTTYYAIMKREKERAEGSSLQSNRLES